MKEMFKMKKYNISEMFFSLEGEGPYANHPTQYLRVSGCNLKCPMFNNPEKLVDNEGYAKLDFDPSQFISIYEMPAITRGCDSTYACRKSFSHLWESLTASEIVDKLIEQIPCKSWIYPKTQLPVIFSITGGEPTMQQELIIELLKEQKIQDCKHILIETNCAVPLKDEFISAIENWLLEDSSRIWTWSNSPKLSSSGELWKRAIRPKIAVQQQTLISVFGSRVNQYFKFVVDNSEEVYTEVQQAMLEYYNAGIRNNAPVWLMPAACTQEQQKLISKLVATRSMNEGYLYSHRIQNDLWDNIVGT
jgi:7-carboxy-7-deazaguanine synthase